MPKKLRVSEAAKILGVSGKTLRRWSQNGKLVPERSLGNQRFYTYQQLRDFSFINLNAPSPSTTQTLPRFRQSLSPVAFVFTWSSLLLLITLTGVFSFLNLKGHSPQESAEIIANQITFKDDHLLLQNESKSNVLAASTTSPILSNYTFNVNVPSVFNNDVTFTKSITAPNIVTSFQGETGKISLTAGTGITISGVAITNSDPGSSQKIFKTIKVGSDTFDAGTNTETLEFAGSGATSVSINTSSKKLTFSSSTPNYTLSGWTTSGTYIYPTALTDWVGIGTKTPEYALDVVGNGHFSGSLTVSDGIIVTDGINNQGGGITNAGAVTGATGLTSSGQITFSSFSTGILHSNFNGVVSSSAIDLSTDVTSVLPVINGGTGISSYSVGDILYASSSGGLAKLSIGGEGQALTIEGGALAWGTVTGEGGTCTNCLVTDPGSTQSIVPTNTDATGLSIQQASSGISDVFSVKNYGGTTTFLSIDSSGFLNIGNTSSSFLGTLKTGTLTENRNYTFPDYSGGVCLDSGNCAGVGSNLGGSGTLNYLSRWAGTYSLESGTIFDNGNIGIGTNDPSTKLQVVGTASISGALTLSSTLNTLNAVNFSSTLGVSGATTLSSTLDVTGNVTSGGNLKIDGTGNSYVLGNLGVGKTEPGLALDVVGSSNVSGSYYLSNLLGLSKSENDLRINDEGDFANTVITNGNVGIGTTTPSAKLDVNQSATSTALNVTADAITTGTGVDFSFDGLTTGTGLNIQSTSGDITSGKVVNIDQSPTKTNSAAITSNALAINRNVTYNPNVPSITKDNQTEKSVDQGSSLSLSHTIGIESNMILVAFVTLKNGTYNRTVSSITYNGIAMTQLGYGASTNGYSKAYIYYMVAPPSGTNTLSVTLSGTAILKLSAVTWYNVNQTTPFGTYGTDSSTGGSSSSITVSSAIDELVIDNYVSAGGTATPDPSQTVLWNSIVNGVPMAASTKPGDTHVTMTWTGNNNYMASIAAPMKPVDATSLSLSGALASFSSMCDGTGVCADSANLLSLSQLNSSATGGIISVSNSGTGADIAFNTSPILRMDDGGTMTWDDGTNTLLSLIDQGTTGLLDIAGVASISGSLAFTNATPYIDVLNGGALTIRTSPSGDGGLLSKFTIANNGNVGIGTDNPASKLDIVGTDGVSPLNIASSSGSAIFSIAANGNIGLGTNTPTALLDIAGNASISGSLVFNGASPNVDILNGGSLNIRTSVGGDEGLASKFTILNSGYVGIGVTNPTYALQVNGTVRAVAISTQQTSTLTPAGSFKGKSTTSGSEGVYISAGTNSSDYALEINNVTNNSNLLMVRGNGYTGIGTDAPQTSLHINSQTTGKAAAIIDQLSDAELMTASSSGITKFSIAKNGLVNATTGGLATFIKAGEVSDTDFSDTAVNGALAVDSSDNRLYVKSGDAWKFIAFSAGFQIPNYETSGLSTGDYLIPYVESNMNDGAVHGMYKKFSDAKEELLSDIYNLIENLTTRITLIETTFSDLANKVTTKESHQETICVGTDGNEVCLNKDQVGELIKLLPTPTPISTPGLSQQSESSPSASPDVAGESTVASPSATPESVGF